MKATRVVRPDHPQRQKMLDKVRAMSSDEYREFIAKVLPEQASDQARISVVKRTPTRTDESLVQAKTLPYQASDRAVEATSKLREVAPTGTMPNMNPPKAPKLNRRRGKTVSESARKLGKYLDLI